MLREQSVWVRKERATILGGRFLGKEEVDKHPIRWKIRKVDENDRDE